MGRSKPSRRETLPSTADSSALLKRATTGISGNGMVSGLKTCKFGATGTHPSKPRRSLRKRRPRSLRFTPGRRVPIEFTQSTRFRRERIRMMCVLLVGSVPQSLLKQIMGILPSPDASSLRERNAGWESWAAARGDAGRGDMPSDAGRTRDLRGIFSVQKGPLPDLQVDEQPQAFAVLGRARAMLLREPPQRGRMEQPSLQRARTEDELLHDRPIRPAQPAAHRDRKSHLSPGEDLWRDEPAQRFPQHRLGAP